MRCYCVSNPLGTVSFTSSVYIRIGHREVSSMIKYPVTVARKDIIVNRCFSTSWSVEDSDGVEILNIDSEENADTIANALNAMNEYPVPFQTDNRLDKLSAWEAKYILKRALKE